MQGTVHIGYNLTVSNDLSVIAIESQITKMLPYHTNCIGYSDLGYSDKLLIMIERREAKHTILYKSRLFLVIADHTYIGVSMRTFAGEPELRRIVIDRTSTSSRPIYT